MDKKTFKEWKKLIFKLSKKSGLIADRTKESMKCKETQLLDNNILLAEIFADLNYKIMLSEN